METRDAAMRPEPIEFQTGALRHDDAGRPENVRGLKKGQVSPTLNGLHVYRKYGPTLRVDKLLMSCCSRLTFDRLMLFTQYFFFAVLFRTKRGFLKFEKFFCCPFFTSWFRKRLSYVGSE